MSCYIVEDATINRIVGFLASEQTSRAIEAVNVRAEEFGDLSTAKGQQALAQSLYDLNRKAFLARYEGRHAEDAPDVTFPLRARPASAMVAYKALCEFTYQCAEGHIPDTSLLFSALRRMEGAIAERIVHSLPEYQQQD